MSGERGRRVEFWLSIAASPSFPSGPLSLPNLAGLDCERTNERTNEGPQSNYMRRLPTRSCFLPVLYCECDITCPRPFVSHKPTPTSITTYLCLFSFLPNFFASVLLHIVTHSTDLSQRLSFHLHLPLTLLRLGVAKSVRYPLPVPRLDFTRPPPHFPSCRRKAPLTFFFITRCEIVAYTVALCRHRHPPPALFTYVYLKYLSVHPIRRNENFKFENMKPERWMVAYMILPTSLDSS